MSPPGVASFPHVLPSAFTFCNLTGWMSPPRWFILLSGPVGMALVSLGFEAAVRRWDP